MIVARVGVVVVVQIVVKGGCVEWVAVVVGVIGRALHEAIFSLAS